MADYDGTLKLLLRTSAHLALRMLTGTPIDKWLDEELRNPRYLRVDLLGEAPDGNLVHLELQSSNEPEMAFRMAEYAIGIYRMFHRLPYQVCLYIGAAPLRMPDALRGPGFLAEYKLIDVRELDGSELLASPELGDNLIAILTGLRDHRDAIRRIVTRVLDLPEGAREEALIHLYTFAGLRRMASVVKEETEAMPIHIDLRENEVLGPPYIRGLEEGEQRGQKQGELRILRRQIEKRFGALPPRVEEYLGAKTTAELEDLSLRLLDAASIDELLK